MKSRHQMNVFQYMKSPEGITKKEKIISSKDSYQTNYESDEETTSSNKSFNESRNNSERCSSLEYFRGMSSVSSTSCFDDCCEKENSQKFHYTSKNNFDSDDFESLNLLGSGAYAKVYKVRHKKTGEIYALKKIDKHLMEKEEKLFQIYLENEFLNLLAHPNIVKTFGIFEDEEKINIVLEYVPKGTLTQYIEKTNGSIENNVLIYFIAQLVSIVEYLNSKNIVHRDIKPDNILIDSNYNLKLVDFATAFYPDKFFIEDTCKYISEEEFSKLPEEKKFFILKSQICQGTPNFMSPEVINNNFKCGIYSDLWSIGCVLYTMVYGFPPFNDKTEYLVFQNILNLNYRFPLNKTVSTEIKDLIKSLLKLNPMERISSNGRLDALKNHCFFNSFNPYTIDDDLKTGYDNIRNRRYSIDFKDMGKFDKNKSPQNAKKHTKFHKAKKSIGKDRMPTREEDINFDEQVITNIIAKIEDDENFDEFDYFYDLKQYEIDENEEYFTPIDKIQDKKAKNNSDKELTLKFELSKNFNLGIDNQNQFKELQKKIEEKEKLLKKEASKNPATFSSFKSGCSSIEITQHPILKDKNKLNVIPLSKLTPQKNEKSNLQILLSHDESASKILKIGNLKMLGPWNFFDNRKIIFYKNLNFEYYDPEKNELKGTICLNQDFIAKKKDSFQFDLINKGKVYSFISRREEEIHEWVDIINMNINEFKKNKLKKAY